MDDYWTTHIQETIVSPFHTLKLTDKIMSESHNSVPSLAAMVLKRERERTPYEQWEARITDLLLTLRITSI